MSAKYFAKCASSVASGGNAAGRSTSVAAVASWLLFLTCFYFFVFLLLWLRAFWPGLALAFGCAFVASRWKAARDNGDKANVASVKCSTLRLIYCVRCTVYRVLCTEYCVLFAVHNPHTHFEPTHAHTRVHTKRGETNAYRHDHYADLWLQHLQLIARLPPLPFPSPLSPLVCSTCLANKVVCLRGARIELWLSISNNLAGRHVASFNNH